ncbi:hypothetical protein CTI12_AA477680 [Artemisia annua]|uniref:CCHC-type domain-containing protein n=1 Tax=Artemisia annua TaxID=35608 RepID=A0A2U1LM87_ARTAN|nr:hypothetical protein CTI12_AA477680 [Artemisia annua]
MAGDEVNNNRVEQLENSLKEFRETVQNSLQQITQTLATLTTHENDERCNPRGPRLSRGRLNDQPQRQRIQQQGEDSNVKDELEDKWNGGRLLRNSYSRVDLVAYKLKGGAQSWWKNLLLTRERQGKLPISSWERMERELRRRNDLSETESQQVTRYINGLSPEIQDRISLVPIYTLDDAYNLAIRAENQLAKRTRPTVFSSNQNSSLSTQSTFKPESSQYSSKSVDLDKKKQSMNTSTERPIVGKCFKCGLPGHRSSDCRATGGKVNLTLKDDEFDNGEETDNKDEDDDVEIYHPEGGDYATKEYLAHSFMVLVPLSDGYITNVSSSVECLAKGTRSVEAKVKKK